jgi:hypothetical protein
MAAVEERTRSDVDVDALEALWRAPDTHELALARMRARARLDRLALLIGWAWIAAFVAAGIWEPVSTEPTPLWVDALGTVFALGALASLGCLLTGRGTYATKLLTAMAPVGLALGATCGMDTHHAAAWWISETAIAAVLGTAGALWWRAERR